jgi:hypothetical protein
MQALAPSQENIITLSEMEGLVRFNCGSRPKMLRCPLVHRGVTIALSEPPPVNLLPHEQAFTTPRNSMGCAMHGVASTVAPGCWLHSARPPVASVRDHRSRVQPARLVVDSRTGVWFGRDVLFTYGPLYQWLASTPSRWIGISTGTILATSDMLPSLVSVLAVFWPSS